MARLLATVLATVTTLLTMDLCFLGILAKGYYDAQLGPLKAQNVVWGAALAFYALYVGAVIAYAIAPVDSVRQATRRGAALGLVAYGTYDLTNWAVIAGWPAALVPVDMTWGVVLTGTVAAVGRVVWARFGRGAA